MAIDRAGAGVVRGQRQPLVAVVPVEQAPEVPGAAPDVLLGVERVDDAELPGGGGHELHQPQGTLGRSGAWVEPRLHLDDGADELGSQSLAGRVLAHQVVVAARRAGDGRGPRGSNGGGAFDEVDVGGGVDRLVRQHEGAVGVAPRIDLRSRGMYVREQGGTGGEAGCAQEHVGAYPRPTRCPAATRGASEAGPR